MISEYLPKNAEELFDLSIDLPDYSQFERTVSKGLQITDKNSLLPVFIIPGLGISRIKPLIDKIMHPVYCAKFPSYIDSVENAALSLLWVTNQIFLFIILYLYYRIVCFNRNIIYIAFKTNPIKWNIHDHW